MQSQVLVQPPPLLAVSRHQLETAVPRALHHTAFFPGLSLLHFSCSPILDRKQLPVAQPGPSYSPPLHVLLDDVPRDHPSSTPPQPYPVLDQSPSRPTSHPRVLSPSLSNGRPSMQDQPAASLPISSSPSPPHIRLAPLFPPPHSAPHNINHFASSATSYPPDMDRYSIANLAGRYLRGNDKYSHNEHSLQDQRRMSDPATYGSVTSGYSTNTADLSNARYHQFQHQYSYVPPRSQPTHSSPLHPSSNPRPPTGSSWKDNQLPPNPYDSVELEPPLSPLNPTFSGGASSPSIGVSGMIFAPLHQDYGPSPPGTGTSTSSTPPATHQQVKTTGDPSSPSNNKQYSFVSLPGNGMKKRPRRRYDEIERLYQCSWENCAKAYGTLNHLNAHITMQKHGPKRSPNEFKDLRKQWRKAKKEEAEARALDAVRHTSQQYPPSQHPSSRHSMPEADYQTHNVRPSFDYAHHPERSMQAVGLLDDPHGVHQRGIYPRRSQRYASFVPPHLQHGGVGYPTTLVHGASTSSVPMNRLPANSTLLTPLSGYEPSSISGATDFDTYPSSYDLHRSDSRPRTGHDSPERHLDKGRTRSDHVTPGAGPFS
ncbi:hypothetical protein JVU11DRAFT_6462 [Chiua virens]|nr:hypothetical protein JVU11DRAFT_6462 [Chiua virens]